MVHEIWGDLNDCGSMPPYSIVSILTQVCDLNELRRLWFEWVIIRIKGRILHRSEQRLEGNLEQLYNIRQGFERISVVANTLLCGNQISAVANILQQSGFGRLISCDHKWAIQLIIRVYFCKIFCLDNIFCCVWFRVIRSLVLLMLIGLAGLAMWVTTVILVCCRWSVLKPNTRGRGGYWTIFHLAIVQYPLSCSCHACSHPTSFSF